jgi:hypothetical protein
VARHRAQVVVGALVLAVTIVAGYTGTGGGAAGSPSMTATGTATSSAAAPSVTGSSAAAHTVTGSSGTSPAGTGSAATSSTATGSTAVGSPTAPDDAAGLPPTLAEALRTIPADVTSVWFTDDAAMKRRWGATDVTSQTDPDSPEFDEYLDHARNAAGNNLMAYAVVMAKDWGWGGLDVQWMIAPMGQSGPPVAVYRMRPDLDMAAVVDSFQKNGFTRSGPDDRPTFHADLGNITGAPPFFDVVVLTEQHLLVTGAISDRVLATIDDPSASLVDNPTLNRLMAGVPAPEFAWITLGGDACLSPVGVLGPQGGPAQASRAISGMLDALAGTHPLDGAAAVTIDDSAAVVTTDFADPADAEADAKIRLPMLTDGTSMVTQRPYTELFSVQDTDVQGRVLRYDLTMTRRAVDLPNMIQRRDTPWAYCA